MTTPSPMMPVSWRLEDATQLTQLTPIRCCLPQGVIGHGRVGKSVHNALIRAQGSSNVRVIKRGEQIPQHTVN